jgi:hypothetical protein
MSQEQVVIEKLETAKSFSDLWTLRTKAPADIPLDWCSLYAYPKEYFKVIQVENQRRDASGWRRGTKIYDDKERKNTKAMINVKKQMKERLSVQFANREALGLRSRFPEGTNSLDSDKKRRTSITKEKKYKLSGRPAAGTPEAKKQTAAACEANRKRHSLKLTSA